MNTKKVKKVRTLKFSCGCKEKVLLNPNTYTIILLGESEAYNFAANEIIKNKCSKHLLNKEET